LPVEAEGRCGLSEPQKKPPAAVDHAGTVPLPHLVKQKIKDGLVAVSLANLCFISAWFHPLRSMNFGFFNNLPINNATLLALLTNILLLGAIFWLVLRALRRWQNEGFHLAIHLLFWLMLLIPLEFFRAETHPAHSLTFLLRQPVGVFVAVVIAALVLWKHRWVAKTAAIVVAILAPLAVYVLAKIVLLFLGVIHLNAQQDTVALAPLSPLREGQPRVVWIIFDEADYRMIYGQRPASLVLPAFDHLLMGSLSADNANSPSDATIFSMPSLILGHRVTGAQIVGNSNLLLQFANTNLIHTNGTYGVSSGIYTNGTYWCSRLSSVFSVARAMGVNTAVVGWYLPYSRLFGKDLNYCSWYPFPNFEPARSATFGDAMLQQIGTLAGPLHARQGYVRLYQQSLNESLSLITNTTYGLMLFHLFPPHAPGIYLPEKDEFTIRDMDKVTGYFNNLVLADRTLAQLSQALEKSGEWDSTWVIVSADHSWRYSREYDGQRDYRVPFLIDPPGKTEAVTYSQPFNTAITRRLILAILQGQITNSTQAVADWLAVNARSRPTTQGSLVAP
jgi:hypothetical protein